MLTLLTIAGLALAIIVFLHLLSAGQRATNQKNSELSRNDPPPRVNPRGYLNTPSEPGRPRSRVCPLCGTVLTQEDYLFAAISPEPENGGKRQAQIYGCRYCFVLEERADIKRAEINSIQL